VAALMVFLFALILVPEVPRMVQRRQWPELIAFMALWAAGLTLSVLIALDVYVGQITEFLRGVFEPIGEMLIGPPPE